MSLMGLAQPRTCQRREIYYIAQLTRLLLFIQRTALPIYVHPDASLCDLCCYCYL